MSKGTWGSKEKKKSPRKKKKKGDKLNQSAVENFIDNHSSALASEMSHIGPV
jgi:hypothetical protein